MRKITVLVLAPLPAQVVSALLSASAPPGVNERAGCVEYKGTSRRELEKAACRADIIIGDYTFAHGLDAGVIEAAGRCLLIQQPSVGYQHIDVDAAARAGIPVANTAGANATAVAEHTVMVVLAALKKLIIQNDKTRQGEWAQDEMATRGVFELSGKTLGIIGMGRIGREVAARAGAFGCAIVYNDAVRLDSSEESRLGAAFVELDELVSMSDVVTVHVPLTPATTGLFDAARIAAMKPDSVLVNVSRGEVVDEQALAAALEGGHLAGAAVDVYGSEPVEASNPLLRAPGVILTPHTAGATNEARMRIITAALDNVAAVLQRRMPVNVVNGVQPDFSILDDGDGEAP